MAFDRVLVMEAGEDDAPDALMAKADAPTPKNGEQWRVGNNLT